MGAGCLADLRKALRCIHAEQDISDVFCRRHRGVKFPLFNIPVSVREPNSDAGVDCLVGFLQGFAEAVVSELFFAADIGDAFAINLYLNGDGVPLGFGDNRIRFLLIFVERPDGMRCDIPRVPHWA